MQVEWKNAGEGNASARIRQLYLNMKIDTATRNVYTDTSYKEYSSKPLPWFSSPPAACRSHLFTSWSWSWGTPERSELRSLELPSKSCQNRSKQPPAESTAAPGTGVCLSTIKFIILHSSITNSTRQNFCLADNFALKGHWDWFCWSLK